MPTWAHRIAIVAALAAAPVFAADTYVERANRLYADIATNLRSDTIILPALADLERPPSSVDTVQKAELITVRSPAWPEAARWAEGSTQQAALTALREVTKGEDFRRSFAFGQPYGIEGVPIDLIRARLYTELGDPPTLAGARHLYLARFDQLSCLVNVEATRLAAAGSVTEAGDLLISLIGFGRQVADRQFYRESEWGFTTMMATLERLRDVLYADFRSADRKATPEWLLKAIERLDEDRGIMAVGRIKFPQADYIAGQQVIDRVFVPRGGVDPARFGPTMAKLGASEYPLRLLGESARWRRAAATHADQIDTTDALNGAFNDFANRWPLPAFDRRMAQPFAYRAYRAAGSRFAVIEATLPDMSALFDLRRQLRVEAIGTRLSLAHLGRFYAQRAFAPSVEAVRPAWLRAMEPDPYKVPSVRGDAPPMEFFVPIRDIRRPLGPRETPQPHEMNIVIPERGENFNVNLGQDQFIVYSVGSDNADNAAARIQNTTQVIEAGADYLIWPPVLSLYRQRLVEKGEIQ